MKPIRIITAALLLAATAGGAMAQTPVSLVGNDSVPTLPGATALGEKVVLSREDCVRIALQDNPTIKIANLEIQRADYSKKETLASLFPNIDFTGSYSRSIQLQTIKMNMGGQTNSIKMGSDNSWNFAFGVSMPLVNASLWQAIKISDTQILANLEASRESRLNLCDQVNKAYYSLLLAKASYGVIKSNYDVARENAAIYEKKFAAGTATEYDVLRSSVQVKNIEPQLLESEIAIRQCKLQLKVLMGIDNLVDIEPNVSLEEMQQEMYSYALDIDRNLSNNSTMRNLEVQTKLASQNVDLKKYAWLPSLGVQFNVAWSSLSNGSPFKNQEFNPYSNVALALSVPIFSGGSKYYGLKGAKVQLAELGLQRENVTNSLNMQIDLAIDNINKEVAQIQTNKEGVRQAVKAHEIMQKSFEIGAATYLNLRDAELAETSSWLAYYQAIYNYLVSTSNLDLLLGKEESLIR